MIKTVDADKIPEGARVLEHRTEGAKRVCTVEVSDETPAAAPEPMPEPEEETTEDSDDEPEEE